MEDIIIFISAYEAISYLKSFRIWRKEEEQEKLFEKYHIDYVIAGESLLSSKGRMNIKIEYDYVTQQSTFSFVSVNKQQDINEYKSALEKVGVYNNLFHAYSILTDSSYFKIDYFIAMQSFLVQIDNQIFQIDPIVFSMNSTDFIVFEVINYKTGIPLMRNEVLGKKGNYNLLKINGYQYFDEAEMRSAHGKISEIIYNNINGFLSELINKQFEVQDYSFIHSTLVITNEIENVKKYFCDLIGVKDISLSLENISTTENYNYYLQDGASVVTNYKQDNVNIALYNGILLESIKLFIYLAQIVNVDIENDINKIVRNDLYLETLFFSPQVPIETNNLLNYIRKTKSYEHHKEALKLKIAYMKAENDTKKNRNAVLLNVLLYIMSFLGAIDALIIIENRFGIPFNWSFFVVFTLFFVWGIVWIKKEYEHNKRF